MLNSPTSWAFVPLAVLILAVPGSILTGLATPTEAAALGSLMLAADDLAAGLHAWQVSAGWTLPNSIGCPRPTPRARSAMARSAAIELNAAAN